MYIKRIVVFTMVLCLLFAMPVSANMKTNWITSSGEFHMGQMFGKRVFKESLKYSDLSKKTKKKAIRLYNKNPRKLYKKNRKILNKMGLQNCNIFKVKLKRNTLTVWGKFSKKQNGLKKKYKFGKYKFKVAKNATLSYSSTVLNSIHSGKKMRKELGNPYGLDYYFSVSRGTIYKIYSLS